MTNGIRHVAVLGTGTIGASWAAFFLARGLSVAASDPAAQAESFTRRFVDQAWPALETIGLAAGADPGRLTFTPDPAAACEGAHFVQENAPERLEIKQALFERVGTAVGPDVLIASSSSTLLPTAMQARCPHPERLVLGHPFNPPHLIPLVEVCGGEHTSAATLDRAIAFYKSLGKHPIRLNKEIPGHVSNRLQAAIWREATYLVEQGVVNVADVDAAVAQGPGLRWALMGPVLTFHLAGGAGGLRHLMDHIALDALWPELGTPKMTRDFQQVLLDGVEAEAAGASLDELAKARDRNLTAILQQLKA